MFILHLGSGKWSVSLDLAQILASHWKSQAKLKASKVTVDLSVWCQRWSISSLSEGGLNTDGQDFIIWLLDLLIRAVILEDRLPLVACLEVIRGLCRYLLMFCLRLISSCIVPRNSSFSLNGEASDALDWSGGVALLVDLTHYGGRLTAVLERGSCVKTISKLAMFHRRNRATMIAR